MLRQIFLELVAIRKELQAIRKIMNNETVVAIDEKTKKFIDEIINC